MPAPKSKITERDKRIVLDKITAEEPVITKGTISLAKVLSKSTPYRTFDLWIVGDTPLIVHAWSEKARREMLSKQVKSVRGGGRAERNPQEDFESALYRMPDGGFGFPAMGFKNALLSVAHKDKGIPRTEVMAALWISADIVSTRPAMSGAICDMPLLRIYGTKPQMREDMVKIGSGLNKTATLAYRPQFTTWACRVRGRFNAGVLNEEQLCFLIDEAGVAEGIGEWRNSRRGVFGAFHRASVEEDADWSRFASGKGKLPATIDLMAAE